MSSTSKPEQPGGLLLGNVILRKVEIESLLAAIEKLPGCESVRAIYAQALREMLADLKVKLPEAAALVEQVQAAGEDSLPPPTETNDGLGS